jgi:acyl carrier protein
METSEIKVKIQNIIKDILDDEKFILSNDHLGIDQIDEWDSVATIQLIAEIEKVFDLKFTFKEILSFPSIETMVNGIQQQLQ